MWRGSLGWLLDVLIVDCYLKIWNNEQNHKSVHVFLVLGCANHKNRRCVHYTYNLLSFSLYNSYFQYSYRFYKEKTGEPLGSPLTVALAEILVTETEQLAVNTSSKFPKHYWHFVDDGFGHFTDKQHATDFLKHTNGLTNDVQIHDFDNCLVKKGFWIWNAKFFIVKI